MKRFLTVSVCVAASISGAMLATAGSSAPGGTPAPVTAVRHGVTRAPRIRDGSDIDEGTSSNWSGYAAATSLTNPASGAVSDVVGTWTVPAVTGSQKGKTQYSSLWVGIDGYSDGTVEQLGTEQDWSHGAGQYYAWYEMYPNPSHVISTVSVHPGDSITASVHWDGASFVLSLTNNTNGQSFSITQSGSGQQRSSAEWIAEAPSIGSVLPLADFGTAFFTGCSATLQGVSGSIGSFANDAITMATRKTRKAVPSALTNGGADFSVKWFHE